MLFTILIFLVDKLYIAVSLLLVTIFIRLAAKIPISSVTLLKNLTLLAFFIILIQSVFGPGNSYIVNPIFPASFPFLGGKGSVKFEGLVLGIVIVCRIASLMVFLPVFTETTAPAKIAGGLCALGLNYRISFIITTAFNLIHVFKNEALIYMDTQKLRGMYAFERTGQKNKKRSFISVFKAYTGLLVPLLLCAMRKAQVSSAAMDSRAFGIYKKRTWINKPVFSICDIYAVSGGIVFFIFMIFLNYR
ncbi:MAG: energy-coupling factor transporter transmembrane protein EcfT [Treponema sp.]|nr:energy-coupling factor transporter transmembrane protein EcfT [Treponema sp.]